MKARIKTLITRLQNPKVIMALVSGMGIVLLNTGLITVDQTHRVNAVVTAVLSILVGLGVISNPDSHVVNEPIATPTIVETTPVEVPVAPVESQQ